MAAAALSAAEAEADALDKLKERMDTMQPKINSMHEALYGAPPPNLVIASTISFNPSANVNSYTVLNKALIPPTPDRI